MVRSASRKDALPKTAAKLEFCLSDRDLESLDYQQKKNPFSASAAPMKLYNKAELAALALSKYGSEEGLEEERRKRRDRRASKALGQGRLDSFVHQVTRDSGDRQQLPLKQSSTDMNPLLAERITVVKGQHGTGPVGGEEGGAIHSPVVLYWMKTALRAHHNPALDIARFEAGRRGCPLVVAAPLLFDYPYASARRIQFVLEGLRDVQKEIRALGLELLVHLPGEQPRPGGNQAEHHQAWAALMSMVEHAALVVTEDMPVPPDTAWLDRLCREARGAVEVWAVDCACVFPARKAGKAYERAYAFRAATEGGRKERLGSHGLYGSPPDLSILMGAKDDCPRALGKDMAPAPAWLPWIPIDLHQADIPKMVASNPLLDHSVAPVSHMEGGSRAGYLRWDRFRQIGGLGKYAAVRNNAMDREGTSRMSPYHRWGMVSPFKIAADAEKCGKFLDEFLVWRELSYTFCCYKKPEDLETLDALPKWARATLLDHANDHKRVLPSDVLEAGKSGDELWDAAQQQLAATGELHNNVRMTWGKAFLPWSPSPEEALRRALHQNHKFALDGCDPCSYGGILWCFGLFDGPKAASTTPVFGSVRQRPTASHARRLPPGKYLGLPP